MIYICKPRRVALYVNSGRKTTAQIKEETGCDVIINGGLYNMDNFTPNCHLKVDGKVIGSDPYKYWGYGWDEGGLPELMLDYANVDNYICCMCLVRDGKPESLLIYQKSVGGYRPRTAIGTFEDGRLWIYADHAGKTPEQMREIAHAAGVKDALLLDGGGSTQGIFPSETVEPTDEDRTAVHNYILVWEEKTQANGTFKLALGAGHYMGTAGKRCLKSLDPSETREWFLNDRVCDRMETLLAAFDGIEVLRLDDSDDGAEDVSLSARTTAANRWGADFYLSVHHNAGINGGSGGGIMAFTHPNDTGEAVEWRDELYDALIAATGLKGNRASPKTTGNYQVLRETTMPAVLLELGFMDSKTDVPIILSDQYAWSCAQAIVDVIVQRAGLTAKSITTAPTSWEKAVSKGYFSDGDKTKTVTFEQLAKVIDKLGMLN